MRGKRCGFGLGFVATALIATGAVAGPITIYSGIDTPVVSGSPLPNSNAAAALFGAAVSGMGQTLQTIDFEGAPLGTVIPPLGLGSGVTLGLSNTSSSTAIGDIPNFNGMFNTTPSGSRYFAFVTQFVPLGVTTVASATFSFDAPIDAFGFYLTGLGTDETFTLGFFDGSSQTLTVPGSGGGFSVGEFFGFTAPGSLIDSVTLTQTFTAPGDNFGYFVGIDDVQFAPVPEPSCLGLLGLGLAGLGFSRRLARRR